MIAVNGNLCLIYADHPKMQRLALLIFRIEFRTDVAQLFGRILNVIGKSEPGIMRSKGLLRPQLHFGGIPCT